MKFFSSILLVISVFIYFVLYINQIYELPYQSVFYRTIVMGIIVVLLVVNYFYSPKSLLSPVVLPFVVYTLWSIIEYSIHDAKAPILNEIYFPLMAVTSFVVFRGLKSTQLYKINTLFCIAGFITSLIFLFVSNVLLLTYGAFINTCYFPAAFLPFYLLSNKKIVRIIGFILAVIPSIIVAKRGAFIGVSVAFIIYIICSKKIKRKYIIPLAIVIFTILAIIISSLTIDNNLINRMNDLSEDGGSGRAEIAEEVVKRLGHNDFIENIIGHGAYVQDITSEGLSAHNDFLEMFWNYGSMGGLIMLYMFVSLIKYGLKLKKQNNELYSVYISSLFLFFFFLCVTNLMFVPSYCAAFGMIWAILYSINFYNTNYKSR